MSFEGMDVDEVDRLIARLSLQADVVTTVIGVVDTAISGLAGVWSGDDLHVFSSVWHQTHRPKAQLLGTQLGDWVTELRHQVAQQRATSGEGGAGGGSLLHGFSGPGLHMPGVAPAVPIGEGMAGVGAFVGALNIADGVSTLGDIWNTPWFKGEKVPEWEKLIPHGSYLSAGLKGIGLGSALGDFASAVQGHDKAGALAAAGDGAFTFASAPVSLLWNGLKSETEFFIPLDSQGMDEHLAWMEDRGYSGADLSQRYSGIQGFINLGNDNVERHAPWMNDAADKVMAKPAEWLYDLGIRL